MQKNKDPRLLASTPKEMIRKFLEIFGEVDQLALDTQFMARDISVMLHNAVTVGNYCRKAGSENIVNFSPEISKLKTFGGFGWSKNRPGQKLYCFRPGLPLGSLGRRLLSRYLNEIFSTFI